MKKIIITGASSTIATCLLKMLPKDLSVVTCGRNKNNDYEIDFSKHNDVLKFLKIIKKEKPQYLFLNHGVLPGKKLLKYKSTEIESANYCNLVSIAMILEQISTMKNLKTVVTSSISGKLGSFDTLYAAQKAGIDLMIKYFSKSIPSSSRLNAISPGIIHDANMTLVRKDKEILKQKLNLTPTKIFTSSYDVSQMVNYLMFKAENINGENININGGLVS